MNHAEARRQIREAAAVLFGYDERQARAIIAAETDAAQAAWFAAEHERGPWSRVPDHCPGPHERCIGAGEWGATGRMPNGHLWYWVNDEHTAGYLAHTGTGTP